MPSSSDILDAKCLIVDDKEANVLLLEQMLRGAGYARITSTMDPQAVCALHRIGGDVTWRDKTLHSGIADY
jgi:CheY-like chemotaxis protein